MIRHAAGIAEIVDDVDAAVTFYTEVLGLELKQRMSPDYAIVTLPGVLHFGIWSRAHAAFCTFGSRDDADRIPLGFHLELEVDDIATAAAQLSERGHTPVQAPRTEEWGQATTRLFTPAGSLLGLATTPWGRRLTTPPEVSGGDDDS